MRTKDINRVETSHNEEHGKDDIIEENTCENEKKHFITIDSTKSSFCDCDINDTVHGVIIFTIVVCLLDATNQTIQFGCPRIKYKNESRERQE